MLDRIRVWLPALLAVSANSPFWQGEDTRYASFRSQLMRAGRRPGRTTRSGRPRPDVPTALLRLATRQAGLSELVADAARVTAGLAT